MAAQVIEFTGPAGETFTVKACQAGADSPIKTADSVAEVENHPGLYRATFTDQGLAATLWRFWATSGGLLVARGVVSLTASSGTFRETIEATASIDPDAVANSITDSINESGLLVDGFTADGLAALRAAEIDLSQWDPESEPAHIYRGLDHRHATSNAFTFTNAGGTWPNLTGCTVRMELRIHNVTAIAGTGTIVTASGANQQVYIEILRTAFDDSAIKDGTGIFTVVRIDGSGNRFPLASGVATLHPSTAPAA